MQKKCLRNCLLSPCHSPLCIVSINSLWDTSRLFHRPINLPNKEPTELLRSICYSVLFLFPAFGYSASALPCTDSGVPHELIMSHINSHSGGDTCSNNRIWFLGFFCGCFFPHQAGQMNQLRGWSDCQRQHRATSSRAWLG